MYKIGIVILNWNSPEDTIRCIDSVLSICTDNFDLIVVDNGSTDDSVDRITSSASEITIIQTGTNLGYAGGNNLGLKEAFARGCDYGLILNNDCKLLNTRALENIIFNGEPNIAIYGLGIAEGDGRGRASFNCESNDYFGVMLRLIHRNASLISSSGFAPADRVSGAAMAISKLFFEAVGPIDERYFLYAEEIDYCLKARANGWGVMYEVSDYVSVAHKRKSVYERPYVWYYIYRNMLLFCRFNCSSYKYIIGLILCIISQVRGIGMALTHRKHEVILMMIRGFLDGLTGKTGKIR